MSNVSLKCYNKNVVVAFSWNLICTCVHMVNCIRHALSLNDAFVVVNVKLKGDIDRVILIYIYIYIYIYIVYIVYTNSIYSIYI